MSRFSIRSKLKKAAIVIGWLILWPCFMFGVAIVALIAAVTLAGETKIGLAVGLFSLLMVLVCWLIIWRLEKESDGTAKRHFFGKRSKYSQRASRIVLKVYTVFGIALLFIGGGLGVDELISYSSENGGVNTQVARAPLVPELSRSKKVDAALRQLGVSEAEILRFSTKEANKFSQLAIENQSGVYISYTNPIDGKFLYGEMEIKTGLDPSEFRSTVAHEYMHHIWYAVLDDRIKRKLESDLISNYGLDPIIRNRTAEYTNNQSLHATELFSFYCTESSDMYLSQYTLTQCSKYIKRGQLMMQR